MMADRRYRDDDGGGSGWTEDVDRGRDYERGDVDRSMFGPNWRRRDEERERNRGGWGSLWSPNDDRERSREQARRDDDRGRTRAWSHDDDGTRSRRYEERDRGDERERYGSDDQRSGLPINETDRLIASNKVEGTAVYGLDGDRLGSIYNFMVDKHSGKVEYAVMTHGGFLGMGTRYFPMPWRLLKYDTRLGGYRVEMTHRDLERAPSFDRHSEPRFDTAYGERVHGWYGLSY
jgi:hypothetical protein